MSSLVTACIHFCASAPYSANVSIVFDVFSPYLLLVLTCKQWTDAAPQV